MDAAISVADRRGLDAVGIREVARLLGVTPAALYTYVADKDELEELVVARLIDERAEDLEWPEDWPGVLRTVAHSLRRLLLDHPVILEVYQRRPVLPESGVAVAERILAVLRAAGLPEQVVMDAYATLHSFVIGFVAVEHGRARARSSGNEREPVVDSTRQLSHRFVFRLDDPSRFDRALTLMIAGVAASLPG